MSNPEIEVCQDIVVHPVRPILREPDAYVHNIYPIPGTENTPDLRSQDEMGFYLIDRLEPEEPSSRFRIVMTPSGYTIPSIERVPSGHKEVNRWRKTKEWLISPKVATFATLGSLALFNLVGNHDTAGGSAEMAGHTVYRWFNPVEDVVTYDEVVGTTPGEVRTISVEATTRNEVGEVVIDPQVIEEFTHELDQAEIDGAEVLTINITGNTSDEWGSEDSIGVPDDDNNILGLDRARTAEDALNKTVVIGNEIEVVVDSLEHVLTLEQISELRELAEANGYDSIRAAIIAVDSGEAVNQELQQQVEQYITGEQNRGVSLSATVEYPPEDIIETKIIERREPGKDNPPEVPKPKFWGFMPLLPVRRRERYQKLKQTNRWQFTPSKQLFRPEIIKEDQDQAWVRLRPEALKDDGTLVDNPWAYTRKYEHLLRDGRIADLLRADFRDAQGEPQSLRVMFVDQAPAQETIDMFEGLLKKFASMEKGKLGKRISGIFVYPSENAGVEHDDPERVAMGIDKQSPSEVLGTYTYALDLVELHMPTTWDPEELEEMFQAFNGPTWVASHEIAGHGTDESDETLRLRRVRARNIPNAHLIDGNPSSQKMSHLSKVLQKLPRFRSQKQVPIEFDISYPVLDNEGNTVTMHARVNEGDPRLAHASESTIVGQRPTQYASTNDSEHYAETAASVTAGIEVPYDEALVNVPTLVRDNGSAATFADGYKPDKRGQLLFTDSVGGSSGSFPVEFSEPAETVISHINPVNDPLIREELIRATRLRTLRPSQMIAILARIARSRR